MAATAAKLLRIIYLVLKEKRDYIPDKTICVVVCRKI